MWLLRVESLYLGALPSRAYVGVFIKNGTLKLLCKNHIPSSGNGETGSLCAFFKIYLSLPDISNSAGKLRHIVLGELQIREKER